MAQVQGSGTWNQGRITCAAAWVLLLIVIIPITNASATRESSKPETCLDLLSALIKIFFCSISSFLTEVVNPGIQSTYCAKELNC